MNPFLLLALALLIPVVTLIILLAPTYFAIYLAVYIQYGEQADDYLFRFFDTIDIYKQLVHYWNGNSATLSVIDFALPTFGIPLTGFLLTLFLIYKFTAYVNNIFRLSV